MSNLKTAEPKTEAQPATETEYSGEALLKMPKSLHRKLAEAAKSEGVDLNQYLVSLLSEKSALSGMGDVRHQLSEINQQLSPEGTSARFRELSERDQRARQLRTAYNNRYVADWESGLND